MMTSTHAGQYLVLISKSGNSQKVVRPSLPTDANKFVLSPTRSAVLCDFYLVAWVWEHKGRTSGCDVRFDLEPRSMGTLSFVACGASIRLLLMASSTSIWWRLCKAVIEQPVLRCACSQSSRACEPPEFQPVPGIWRQRKDPSTSLRWNSVVNHGRDALSSSDLRVLPRSHYSVPRTAFMHQSCPDC
jgi:hypothetical protein